MRLLLSIAVIASSLAQSLHAQAQDSNFTPLDEIERVRAAGCGLDQFAEFLTWYTSATEGGGWPEQVIFTDFSVLIGSLKAPDAPPTDLQNRQDYIGTFRITGDDYRASRENRPQVAGFEYRKVTLRRVNEKRYQVNWQGGPSWAGGDDKSDWDRKQGAYVFEFKKDCWYLVADLR